MPGIKRSHSDGSMIEPAAKHPKSQLRPAQYKPTLEVIEISSDEESPFIANLGSAIAECVDYKTQPAAVILPSDSLQDIPIKSIEGVKKTCLTGSAAYRELLGKVPRYESIQIDFDQHRWDGHRSLNGSRNPDQHAGKIPNLGPRDPDIDYTLIPDGASVDEYDLPVYKGITYNPIIPMAIINIAEKNLPFIDFSSALNNLPNLGTYERYPSWHSDVDFLDTDTPYIRKSMDQPIRIVFFPRYYEDGRHAIGFYTRRLPSLRLGSILFTPCTDSDLTAARIWQVISDEGEWRDNEFGVADGEWLYGDKAEHGAGWKSLVLLVEREWDLRLALTLGEVKEGSKKAACRDGGLWGVSWCE